jgi:hypothetical protein
MHNAHCTIHIHTIFACSTFSFNEPERWYCSNCPSTYCTLNNRSVRRNIVHIFLYSQLRKREQLTERKWKLNLCFLSDYVCVFTLSLNHTGSKEGECETQLTRRLKGRCHDIFCFCFISSNSFIITRHRNRCCRRYCPLIFRRYYI